MSDGITLGLFSASEPISAEFGHLTIIPTSVIDIAAQGKRLNENHGTTSSRANFSPFPEEVVTLCYEFYLRDSISIFDPFAGWGQRGAGAERYRKEYVGFDTSMDAIEKAKKEYGVENRHADSLTEQIPEFDGFFTCPPYWNIEKYNGKGIDRNKTWDIFLFSLKSIFLRSYESANPSTTFCIVVGDWRKGGVYYDLEYQVCDMFKEFGATIIDKVVLSRAKVSKIKIMLPQAKRLGYSVRVHENLLVFRKPA